MKGSIKRYCFCKDPETGKELGRRCPRLKQTKHGEWEYRDRLTTATGQRPFRRRGFPAKNAAEDFRHGVYQLLDLARGDTATAHRIADLIFAKTKRGGQLPAREDVRRRLGVGRDLDRSETFGEAWPVWLAGK